jgi:phosphoglycolate phosphatase-like HAD superfamily hydrolase
LKRRPIAVEAWAACDPQLVIFDKDGTLLDFHSIWSTRAIELGSRMERVTGLPLAEKLYGAMGFHADTHWLDTEGPLARGTMADLKALLFDVLLGSGLSHESAARTVTQIWYTPDALAELRPLADIPALFRALRESDMRIAVATMDDRSPTEATFAALGVADMVDVLICGDDGLPPKPAPDMVWTICRAAGIEAARTVVVGDGVTDMQMGRAAGVGAVVGVSTGVDSPAALGQYADAVLESVAELVQEPAPS